MLLLFIDAKRTIYLGMDIITNLFKKKQCVDYQSYFHLLLEKLLNSPKSSYE